MDSAAIPPEGTSSVAFCTAGGRQNAIVIHTTCPRGYSPERGFIEFLGKLPRRTSESIAGEDTHLSAGGSGRGSFFAPRRHQVDHADRGAGQHLGIGKAFFSDGSNG